MHDYWTLMKKLIWLRILQGASFVVNKITGTSPITLTNAINSAIISLKQYGKCVQDGTPTPSSPVDIKCNNGKLGIISEGVPIEYIRIEYLQSSGAQYIDTGITINYATQRIEQRATVQYTTSNTNRELMGANGYGFWGKSAENKLESATGSTVPITESALVKNTVSLITDPNNNNQVTFIVNSNRYDSSASTLADNNYACYVFALGGRSGAAASFFCHAKVYEYAIILDNVMVSHLIPVKRRSDGVLGMYDTVTNSFKVNAGTGTFTAGSAIGSVGVIGTPEVLTVSRANLLNPQTVPGNNQFISRNNGDTLTPSASGGVWRHSDYIPVIGGETYYFHQINAAASTAGTAWYDSEQTYIGGINATALDRANNKVTMPLNAAYLRHSWRIDDGYNTNWENTVYICVDGTMSEFHPYVEPQTVNDIATLLAVGNYADEQDIISGLVTRKCRAKVLDGTESYTKANSGNTVRFRLNNVSDLITGSGMGRIPAIYSHFQDLSSTSSQSLGGAFAFPGRVIYFIPTDQTLDLNEWKSWVAQQYADGTPVIVIYPLVQETTEQTTPHELHSYEGDTTVSWTAGVDGTVKTVEYAQGKQASNKVGTAKVGTAKVA